MSEKLINVNFEDKESLKKGLDEFAYHMDKFYNFDYDMFDDEISILSNSDYKGWDYLIEKALEFGFEDKVVQICTSLLEYMKKINCFHESWYDEEIPFGFDLLFTLAYYKPKYSYMMSEYFTSDWDDQSLHIHHYFYLLYEKYGASDDIINALSYINYGRKLYENIGFVNPIYEDEVSLDNRRFYNKLKEDKNLYDLLKSSIIKNIDKFNGDYLYDYEETHVIEEYFSALGAVDIYDEEEFEEFKKEKIHGKTIASEIEELKEKLDGLFYKNKEQKEENDFNEDFFTNELLRELFIYIQKSKELEEYINTGKNKDSIKELKPLKPKDYKKLKYILQEQYPILSKFVGYYGEIKPSEIQDLLEVYSDSKDQMIRLLDILLKVTFQITDYRMLYYIVYELQLMSFEEYEERYINKNYLSEYILEYYDRDRMIQNILEYKEKLKKLN